ncbi:MAG: UDP-N-acetylglucosamine diphosphorylase [Clostridia bacterium]|nr:UDP-N-acetylglucosamine diphosphorylase [Clostridia bacterium]
MDISTKANKARAYMEKSLEKRLEINGKLLENGVSFLDIESAFIDENVKIGAGTKIYPNVVIEGDTVIGEGCVIGMGSKISNSTIGDKVNIETSYIIDSKVGNETNIGPFAYLRPNSVIGNNCKVGDFVEVKNSSLGDGTKSAHLTYIGDSDLGKGINLGCGVVFVNYDGTNKFRSEIGDNAFIGCNTNIVSPVKVGEGAYIAAGSTVTKDVPEDALCIARSKETIKENWAKEKGLYKKK